MIAAPTRWTYAAYAVAAALVAGVASCMWAMPLPVTDNLLLILDAQRTPLLEGLRVSFLDPGVLRPFYWGLYRVLIVLSGGHYYAALQGFHVAMLAITVALALAVLRVRSAADFAGASVSVMALLGLHTFGNVVRELPILVVTSCAMALLLAFADRPAWWRDLLAVLNLIVAMLYVETGLLVWVVHAAAWLTGRRGVSSRGLGAASAMLAAYVVLRLFVLPSGLPTLFPRDTGFGFALLDQDALQRQFGDRPWALYLYNVCASVSSVLFAEPRGGVFQFARRVAEGGLRPWMYVNVVSSTALTLCLAWWVWQWRGRLRRWSFDRNAALAVVAAAVLVANAVISYPYVRDVTLGPAGFLYALAAAPAVAALLARAERLPRPGAAVLAALLVAMSALWAVRVVSLTYSLRVTAFVNRNDWADVEGWLEKVGRTPRDPASLALVQRLKHEALGFTVPNPGVAQQYAEAYLGTGAY